MSGAFVTAMQHICTIPSFLDFGDYFKLIATRRYFGADTMASWMLTIWQAAAAEHRKQRMAREMQCGLDAAMCHICDHSFLNPSDYATLQVSSHAMRDIVFGEILARMWLETDLEASDSDSSTESRSENRLALWMLFANH